LENTVIRIDFKVDGDNVLTTWVQENGDRHSMMGRVVFTAHEWRRFHFLLLDNDNFSIEEKK
jgi:hypothetical protein